MLETNRTHPIDAPEHESLLLSQVLSVHSCLVGHPYRKTLDLWIWCEIDWRNITEMTIATYNTGNMAGRVRRHRTRSLARARSLVVRGHFANSEGDVRVDGW